MDRTSDTKTTQANSEKISPFGAHPLESGNSGQALPPPPLQLQASATPATKGEAPIQMRSHYPAVQGQLGFWTLNRAEDSTQVLGVLSGLNAGDFNDTVRDIIAHGVIMRFIRGLDRAGVLSFLHVLAEHGTDSLKIAVFEAVPLFNLDPENHLIVFGRDEAAHMGARGPIASAAMRTRSIGPVATDTFSGSGATGQSPADNPMGLWDMREMRRQVNEAEENGLDLNRLKYHRTPGYEMIFDWSNPIKGQLTGPGSWLDSLPPGERENQARVLFGQEISTQNEGAYAGALPTRIQVVRSAAATHNLEPEMISAIILAEQRDQSANEDAVEFAGATIGHSRGRSIGLGQVTVMTAQNEGLFEDLLSPQYSQHLTDNQNNFNTALIARMLASDEFNIFATARYLRTIADRASALNIASLPNTQAWVGSINMALYAGNSSTWTDGHRKLIGSEYTSRPFDDRLVTGWGEFVLEAYNDVVSAGIY